MRINDYYLHATVVACLFVGILYPNPITFTIGAFLIFLIAGRLFKRSFMNTLLGNLLVGFVVTSSVIAFVSTIAWLLPLKAPLWSLYTVSCLCIVIVSILRKQKSRLYQSRSFTTSDFFTIVVALIVICVNVFGIMWSYRGNIIGKSAVLQTITYGIDDISHLNMYKDTVEANDGLLLGSKNLSEISKKDNGSYPKMSHLIPAVYASHATKDTTTSSILFSYFVSKIMVFVISVMILCMLCLEVILKSKKDINKVYLGIIGAVVLTYIIFVLIQPLFQEGFFSVWPILSMIPVLLFTLMDYRKDKKTERGLVQIIIMGLLATALMMSWPIVAIPVYVAIAALLAAQVFYEKKVSSSFIRKFIAASVFAGVGLTQLAVQNFDKSVPISAGKLSEPGGIIAIPVLLLLVFFLIAFFAITRLNCSDESRLSILSYLLFSAALLGVVALINQYSTGSLQYFFYKSAQLTLVTLALFVVPLFVATMFSVVETLKNRGSSFLQFYAAMTATVIFLIFSTLSLFQNSALITYVIKYSLVGERKVTQVSALSLSSVLDDSQRSVNQKEVVINQDNPTESYYMTSIQRAVNRFDACTGEVESFVMRQDTPIEDQNISLCNRQEVLRLLVIDESSKPNQLSEDRLQKIRDFYSRNVTRVKIEKVSL